MCLVSFHATSDAVSLHSEKTGEQVTEDKVGVMVNGCVAACVYMYIHLLQVVIVMWKEETLMPCIPRCHVK